MEITDEDAQDFNTRVSRTQVKSILDRTYPDYKGRKIRLCFTDKVCLSDLNWSGGTRSEYVAVSTSGETSKADNYTAPWNNKQEGVVVQLQPHIAIVKHTIFCGHDIGIIIYLHPGNLPRWLPKGLEV